MVQIEENTSNEKLPPAQPEEQGECRGKAASRENGESEDEADEATWAFASVATEDLEPHHMSSGQPRGEGGGEEGVSWINPRKHPKGRCKVYPEMTGQHKVNPSIEGDTKSNPGEEDDAKSNPHTPIYARPDFESAEPISTPMDHENSLLKGQHHSSRAEIIKTRNLPYREGIGPLAHTPKPNDITLIAITQKFWEEPPQFSSDKSRGGGGTSCINARKDEEGATRLNHAKCDLRGLKGEGEISLVRKDEKDLLPDPGGVPQHRKVGYRPMVDGRPVPGTPRKGANAMWTTKAEEETVSDCQGFTLNV
jgi:hypothetical protein